MYMDISVAEKSPANPVTLPGILALESSYKGESSEVQTHMPFRNAPPVSSQMRQEGN